MLRASAGGPTRKPMVQGRCNSLMNYPQTHQLEGKEETGQRRKAILVGRIEKTEERMRVEVRRDSFQGSYSRRPPGRMTEVSKVSWAAYVFPTQAEDAFTEIL